MISCKEPGCTDSLYSRGYCRKHYMRMYHQKRFQIKRHCSLGQRLLQRINRQSTGCWEWTGYLNEWGYGVVRIAGRSVHAHRASYEVFIGKIPDGMFVCHRCDNPRCINPDHLFLGTHADNMDDMSRKGRGRSCRGATHHSSKLTNNEVHQIRQCLSNGQSAYSLGKEYGVSKTTILKIKKGRIWAWLPETYGERNQEECDEESQMNVHRVDIL